jgi:beta-lactamase class A
MPDNREELMTTRRDVVRGAGALAACGWIGAPAWAANPFEEALASIERESGGRLGVAVLDTGSQFRGALHADDRFPMCSTFKLLASAAVLKRVDEGKERLDRRVKYEARDLVTYSPTTEKHVGDGMTVAEICEAAITLSDNTAGNLILASLGGPQGLTAFARSIGDPVTRLDRIEAALNEAVPGDPRDTTTPNAMLKNVQALVLGDVLSASSKGHLTEWLLGNKTGAGRLRARLPAGWRVGDKTGSGERGTTNDIGVIWPVNRKPVVVTIYLTETAAAAENRNATLAAVGNAITGASG